MTRLRNWYGRLSPKTRMTARTAGVAVVGYLYESIKTGNYVSLSALATGAIVAGGSAVLGVLGLEPFVGFNKPDIVKVPEDTTTTRR